MYLEEASRRQFASVEMRSGMKNGMWKLGVRRHLVLLCAAALCCGSATLVAARDQPFVLGADISWIPEDEAAGVQYFDRDVRKDIFEILKGYHFNYVRLRIFVNPRNGYSRNGGFCDLEHTKAMAKRIEGAGMGFLLDFHYSDTWADPEHQDKPLAWRSMSVEELEKAVADHTREVLTALKAQGTMPQMVQIGNEITHGMLWPEGRVWSQIPSGNRDTDARTAALGGGIGNYDNLARFVKAGIAATKEVDPSVKIVLHNHLARNTPRMVEWMDELLKRDVKFDIIGMSAYAQGKEGDWKNTFDELARRYPNHKQMVLEYSAQKEYLNDLVFNIPGDRGLGTFIWEPTRHREALFNRNGVNAGGGQASNFVNDMGINQGATTQMGRGRGQPPATQTATLMAPGGAITAGDSGTPATAPARGRGRGGRYDTNVLFEIYPKLYQKYQAK
jgi:arabinogalactan endo-1,4-beta-galactosidase